MNLLCEFEQLRSGSKSAWCGRNGIFPPRIKRLSSSCKTLVERVATFLQINPTTLRVTVPPRDMERSIVLVLRVILVWVFNDSIIEIRPGHAALGVVSKSSEDEHVISVPVRRGSAPMSINHLKQVFQRRELDVKLQESKLVSYSGTFRALAGIHDRFANGEVNGFLDVMEPRMLSFASELNLDVAFCVFSNFCVVYCREGHVVESKIIEQFHEHENDTVCESLWTFPWQGRKKGIKERPCGLWVLRNENLPKKNNSTAKKWTRVLCHQPVKFDRGGGLFKSVRTLNMMWWEFRWSPEQESKSSQLAFNLRSSHQISGQDMRDMLSTSDIITLKEKTQFGRQSIDFSVDETSRGKKTKNGGIDLPSKLSTCAEYNFPIGVRLLAVLASGRRQRPFIRFGNNVEAPEATPENSNEPIDIFFDDAIDFTKSYWRRLGANPIAYVQANSVPASAIPSHSKASRFCCSTNTVEVRGGAVRAMGLTLLPSREFLALSLLSFGVHFEDDEAALKFLSPLDDPSDIEERLVAAYAFHMRSLYMGESLLCRPNKVKELLAIFDGLDSIQCKPWNDLLSNPFVDPAQRLSLKRIEMRTEHSMDLTTEQSQPVEVFGSKNLRCITNELFATSLACHGIPDRGTLYSSNLLALLVATVRQRNGQHDWKFSLSKGNPDWLVEILVVKGKCWITTKFLNHDFRYKPRSSPSSSWLSSTDPQTARPSDLLSAKNCLPVEFRDMLGDSCVLVQNGAIYHKSLVDAVRVESSFWLERQFKVGELHWYQQSDLSTMLATLQQLSISATTKR